LHVDLFTRERALCDPSHDLYLFAIYLAGIQSVADVLRKFISVLLCALLTSLVTCGPAADHVTRETLSNLNS